MVKAGEKNGKKKGIRPLISDYHLLSYDVLDSTNSEARRIAEGGGAHGAFLWAKRQTAGRGRQGREWISHEGNLFVSVLLNPSGPFESIPQLSFIASLAAAESIQPLLPQKATLALKWPNDILLEGCKLGGILLESFETLEADGPRRWAIVGLGLNIDHCPDAGTTHYPATYLKDAGVEIVSAKIVLSRFIHHFIDWYDIWQQEGFEPVRKAWLKLCAGRGKEVKISLPNETITGIFHSLDKNGTLSLKLADGKTRKIAAGDLYFL